jgi:hypothetical protein
VQAEAQSGAKPVVGRHELWFNIRGNGVCLSGLSGIKRHLQLADNSSQFARKGARVRVRMGEASVGYSQTKTASASSKPSPSLIIFLKNDRYDRLSFKTVTETGKRYSGLTVRGAAR